MTTNSNAGSSQVVRKVRGRLGETTEWFPAYTPPNRVGLYECECGEKHTWDGEKWHVDGGAFKPDHWYVEAMMWRGLKRKPPNDTGNGPRQAQLAEGPR